MLISKQSKLTSQINNSSHELSRVQRKIYIIFKMDVYKIENQLNIRVFV